MVANNCDGVTINKSQPPHAPPSIQISPTGCRRSPRLVGCSNSCKGIPVNSDKTPVKKKQKVEAVSCSVSEVPFFIGDPVPDDEARRRWPWRYHSQSQELNNKRRYPNTKNDDDDDDQVVLNVKCHYLQAKIEGKVFDLGDCATVKGEEGGHNHVGRILEFFKTNDGEDYFRVQWFFRAEDTAIKDAAASNNKKRLFYSTLMNDNPLDCIVSKVKVLKKPPGVC